MRSTHSFMEIPLSKSQYSWADPLDDEAGPGSYNVDSSFGKKNPVKSNSVS